MHFDLSKQLCSAAAIVAVVLLNTASAGATPVGNMRVSRDAAVAGVTTDVQYRRGGDGWRRGGGDGWRRGGGGYRSGGWRRGGGGPGIGFGLATGAIIGGALAAGASPGYASDDDAYCVSRFRSYDPASGTYLGNDGLRHSCP